MAEELEKYKQILKREVEEFKEAMKAEVNTSLPSKSSKQKKDRILAKHMLSPISYRVFSIFL